MKKVFLTAMLVLGLGMFAQSQVNPRAIGLRGGSGNYGSGAELSYQHGLGDANRLEFDLGLRSSSNHQHFVVSGIYHWVNNITSGLNWFVGPGAQLGFYQYKFSGNSDGITIGVGGQIGLEFDFNEFDIPLLLSLDTRPMFGLIGGSSGFNIGGSFGLRYTF